MAQVAFGVLRPADAATTYRHAAPEFRRLAARGALHSLATGYYAVVPAAARGMGWRPTIEAAAYGIAAADYGPDEVVLMGLSAARLHNAIPRALAVAVVAVPKQRPALSLSDRTGRVIFVKRSTDRLDAERMTTDLGTALVTGIEQTVLDLAHRPNLGGVASEARAAIATLWPQCRSDVVEQIAVAQRLRAARERAAMWAAER